MSRPVIGFAGMTHLGVNSAAAAMARGFEVVAYDPDAAVIRGLQAGKPPVTEPGLEEALHQHAPRARYTTRDADLAACDVVYISSDVATDEQGASDLAPVLSLIKKVSSAMKREAVLVVLCQVPPGFTRALALPRLYYQVETLVFGRALDRALNPERFILGCADPSASLPNNLENYLRAFGCPILPMGYESAELAKIAINCCLVSSISVANTLAELCEGIGADWSEIVPALKLDKRIGEHAYLAPGLGIAGGNLERDLATVLRFSGGLGTDASVVKAWLANSRHRRDWVLRVLHRELLGEKRDVVIAVLGLAYKENTRSTRNSPSLALIRHLNPWRLRIHDPVVPVQEIAHQRATGCAGGLEAAQGADALVIMTPWPEYKGLDSAALSRAMRGRLIVDPYRMLDGAAASAAGFDYFALGAPPARTPRKGRHA